MIKTIEIVETTAQFRGKNGSIEPGEILTLENAEVIDGQIKVVDKFNNVFSISSAFYRLCNVLTSTGWYFDSVSRDEATRVLSDKSVGSFLVRRTEPNRKQHVNTLVIKTKTSLRNYRIYKTKHYFISEERLFSTLFDLVCYYFDTGDGLTVRMTKPGLVAGPEGPRRIRESDITIGEQIGHGHFGEVYHGILEDRTGRRKCAIKKLKKEDQIEEKKLLQEATLWSGIYDDSIVGFIGISGILIVAELMELGSLQNYLRDDQNDIWMEDQMHWIHDIIKGLVYLRQQNIVHRDIAARNILLNKCLKAKISDLGMAIKMDENQEYWNPLLDNRKKEKLPVRWTSPEAATDHHFSYASDMWAAGVTMFEICSCGQRPYKDYSNRNIQAEISKGLRLSSESYRCADFKETDASSFYKDFYNLQQRSWEKETNNRITIYHFSRKFQQLYKRYLTI